MKLAIELVPETAWYANLRSELPKDVWDRLRRESYQRANYRCEICGGVGRTHPVECHEVWQYNDKTHVQKLVRLITLCPACHEVKHIGRAEVVGRYQPALKHFMQVNQLSLVQARQYIEDAVELWRERSEYDWQIDLSNLPKEVQNLLRRSRV